jgi:putative tryptophan/tyrosine transport system substrate-binding protein
MMHRRKFVVSLAGFLAVPAAIGAQEAKTWRIGYLSLSSPTLQQSKRWIAAFKEGLERLGYVPGKNAIVEQRYAAGEIGRLPVLAAQLIDLKVDIVVAAPAGTALAVKKITHTVPIVFMGEPDPVAIGLVASLARPGGNVTGLADAHGDLIPKRLELLKQVIRPSSRVGVLWNPANPSSVSQFKTAQAAASALDLAISPVDVRGPGSSDIDRAFAAVDAARLGGLLVIAEPTLGNHRQRIAELSIKHRLPTSGTHRGWVEGGLLMSYGTDFIAMFRGGATLVDKILKGAKPADLPVQQPTKFELLINLKTAKEMELTIPPSLLSRADAVIE